MSRSILRPMHAVSMRRSRALVSAGLAVLSMAACDSSGGESNGGGSGATVAAGGAGTGGKATSGAGASSGGSQGGAVETSGGTLGRGGGNLSAGTTGGAGRTGNAGSAGTGTAGSSNTAGRGGNTGVAGSASGRSAGGQGGSAGSVAASGSGGTTGSAASGATCPGTLAAGDSNQAIMSSGMSRKFIVHLPTGYTGSAPLPVIFDFHPLGGTGASQETASGWGKKCDSVGCIAVFPDSGPSDNSWNVGFCCSDSQQQKVDDVQFTRDMIKWLAQNTCIDPKKIYASGCSNGGGMAYMLACNAADVIAAVAPVDFRCVTGEQPSDPSSLTATNNTACTCKLPRPISVMGFDEGQDMSIVPYDGGKTVVPADCPPGGSCAAFNFPGAQVNIDTWANFDACTGSAATDATNSICKTYASCGGGTEVSLCTAASSNHCGSYGLSKIVDTAWDMFQKQTLP
ncbi:MAG TPA: hypothetical protein VMI54_01670 [Polyangiaceae bacterium]|nr:hypothetical protein [Polyangiaceae bacterium]